MEIRMILDDHIADYVKAVAKARRCTTGSAVNTLLEQVVKDGKIRIVDDISLPVSGDDKPPM